ncbi:hypothetical protein BDZ89DRAFT_254639 [Hymenopellis radicata]|nr:hypothetical protein BDZ89DRAFT_254639 [Hymenopellis radicata]
MASSARTVKLNKYLETVLSGKETVLNAVQSKQFIDAICAQQSPTVCIDRLFAAGNRGLGAIQAALRTDLSLAFLDGHASDLLAYLQAPEIKSISGGSYLHKTLKAIVEEPFFWNALIGAFKDKHLSPRAQKCFGWVLLQLLLIPSDAVSPHLSLAEEVEPLLLSSRHLDIHEIGSRIQNTIAILSGNCSIMPTQISGLEP